LAETLEPGAVVSVVARRHGLTPQQLFGWRREARKLSEEAGPKFVPAVIEPPSRKRRTRQQSTAPASIELEIAGVRVRIGNGVKASTVSAVIRALKANS
jgi:transposase